MLLQMLVASSAFALLAAVPAHAMAQEHLPGFGDSMLLPTGQPFVLPEGLELTVITYNPFDKENTCKRPDAEEGEEPLPDGGMTGGFVPVCLQFKNNTRNRIDVQLPPGLVWISSSDKHQNGILFQKVQLEVPSDQYLFAPIMTDCMNVSRSAPGLGIPYEVGPVTDNPHILEALALLADRDISDPHDAATASNVMQQLYVGKPLTDEGRLTIMELPPA